MSPLHWHLGEVILTSPDEAAETSPLARLDEAELPEPADWVARRIRELTPVALRGREEVFKRCNARLGMKKSSFNSTLHSFRHLGPIDLVAFQRYGVSAEFSGLLDLGNEIDLVRYLHTRYAFVAEILGNADAARPVGDLVRIAKEQYGQHLSDAEVRTRLVS